MPMRRMAEHQPWVGEVPVTVPLLLIVRADLQEQRGPLDAIPCFGLIVRVMPCLATAYGSGVRLVLPKAVVFDDFIQFLRLRDEDIGHRRIPGTRRVELPLQRKVPRRIPGCRGGG